jgi:hypothetical protein
MNNRDRELPKDLYFKARDASAGVSTKCQRRVCKVLRVLVFAAPHNANAALFWCACRLAEFVDQEWLTRKSAEELLVMAAMMRGQEQGETWRSIKSGFERTARDCITKGARGVCRGA